MKTEEKKITNNFAMNSKRRNSFLFVVLSLFTVFIMSTENLFPLPKSGYVDVWSMCNWGLNYETGFILRGFVGTALTALLGTITYKQIYIISLILFIILVAQFIYLNINIYKKSQSITTFILIFFLMSQPSNARWLMSGAMFARLDNFIIILAIIGFYLIYKLDGIWMYFALLPLSILAIAIHEVFAVAFSSLIFALIMLKESRRVGKINFKPLLLYYLPVLAFFIVVIIFGGTDLSREKFTQIMQQNLSIDLRDGMISVARDIVVDDLSMKVERVKYLFTKDTKNLMILTYVVISPTLILFSGIFIKIYKAAQKRFEKISIILIIGSCFAPLTSSLFGCDHFRWIGYFIFCVSIAIVFLYFINEKYREIILEYTAKYAIYIIIASVIAMTFGTFRNMQTLPFLEGIYYERILVLPSFFN